MITLTYRYRKSRAGFNTVTYDCSDMIEADQITLEIKRMWIKGETIEINKDGELMAYLERN